MHHVGSLDLQHDGFRQLVAALEAVVHVPCACEAGAMRHCVMAKALKTVRCNIFIARISIVSNLIRNFADVII